MHLTQEFSKVDRGGRISSTPGGTATARRSRRRTPCAPRPGAPVRRRARGRSSSAAPPPHAPSRSGTCPHALRGSATRGQACDRSRSAPRSTSSRPSGDSRSPKQISRPESPPRRLTGIYAIFRARARVLTLQHRPLSLEASMSSTRATAYVSCRSAFVLELWRGWWWVWRHDADHPDDDDDPADHHGQRCHDHHHRREGCVVLLAEPGDQRRRTDGRLHERRRRGAPCRPRRRVGGYRADCARSVVHAASARRGVEAVPLLHSPSMVGNLEQRGDAGAPAVHRLLRLTTGVGGRRALVHAAAVRARVTA